MTLQNIPIDRLLSVATDAARRLIELGGDASLSRQWLLPIWQQMIASPSAIDRIQKLALVETVALGFASTESAPDAQWLGRIEAAQLRDPGDALLQYLAGITCQHLQLWGKAQQLLTQCLAKLRGSRLENSVWMALASLAEQRGDDPAASQAWRNAAITATPPNAA